MMTTVRATLLLSSGSPLRPAAHAGFIPNRQYLTGQGLASRGGSIYYSYIPSRGLQAPPEVQVIKAYIEKKNPCSGALLPRRTQASSYLQCRSSAPCTDGILKVVNVFMSGKPWHTTFQYVLGHCGEKSSHALLL